MRPLLAAITAAIFLGGCSSHTIQLTPASDQQAIYRDGLPALVSQKKHVVMIRPNVRQVKGNSRPSFTVAVLNADRQPHTLFEKAISAYQFDQGKSVPLRVYSHAELVQEEQTRQTIAAVGVALSAAGRTMSASNAGYVKSTGSINTYGAYGSTHSTYRSTTYDPLRAQLAQNAANAQTQYDIARMKAQGENNLRLLQGTILKDNPVLPGEWYGGTVVLDPPSGSDNVKSYELSIQFGGEQHTFSVSHLAS